ncbi:MAG: DNA primase [Flavobacteriaceae bacterium]
MISKTTIDQVYETARVEEVIGDFVTLKKSGANYKGLSPFSQEKTPSFMVSPVKQIWKDFSSGKGGNVVAFLMEHEHFTYPEAIRYLAKKYAIEIEETQLTDEDKEKANTRESLYLATAFAQEFFEENLWNTTRGKAIGWTYFQERGFTDETIRKFGLGYSPETINALSEAAKEASYNLDFLEQCGLTIATESGPIDRFRGRVIFPIKSMSGRVQGFGGRILGENKKTAKYLNSPESDIYHKSKVLFGLFEAKKAIAKEDVCYLVEGYTDVIQLHQAGIEAVVSSSGTALTAQQIQMIRRLTKNIVVLFDGDDAGLRAALRGVDLILEAGLNVRVVRFPEGEDPDSFAKAHTQEVIEKFLSTEAQNFIAFKANLLTEEAANDPIRKAEAVREIVASIAKIPDPIKQELYVRESSQLLQLTEVTLFDALAQEQQKLKRESSRAKTRTPQATAPLTRQVPVQEQVDPNHILEQQIISILVRYGSHKVVFHEEFLETNEVGEVVNVQHKQHLRIFEKIFLDLQQDEIELADPIFHQLYESIMSGYAEDSEFNLETETPLLDPVSGQLVADILMEDEKYELHQWDRKNIPVKAKTDTLGLLVEQTILAFRMQLIREKIQQLSQELKSDTIAEETNLMEEIHNYIELKRLLAHRLERVI